MSDADPSRRIRWFHSHAYFDHEDPARVGEARTFFDRIAAEVARPGQVDVHRFIPMPVGPHPRGSFEVLFTREAFTEYVTWLAFHCPRAMSILVHPISSHHVADHTDHAIWLGAPLALLLDVLIAADAKNIALGRSEESIIEAALKH